MPDPSRAHPLLRKSLVFTSLGYLAQSPLMPQQPARKVILDPPPPVERQFPPLRAAGIDQQPYQIGVHGIEIIIGGLHRNDYGIPELPCNTSVPPRWVDEVTRERRIRALITAKRGRPRCCS